MKTREDCVSGEWHTQVDEAWELIVGSSNMEVIGEADKAVSVSSRHAGMCFRKKRIGESECGHLL